MALTASGLRDAVLVFDTGIAEPGWLSAPRYPRERSGFSAALTNGDFHWYQTSKSGGNRTDMAIESQRRCGTSHAAARRPRWHAHPPSPALGRSCSPEFVSYRVVKRRARFRTRPLGQTRLST